LSGELGLKTDNTEQPIRTNQKWKFL